MNKVSCENCKSNIRKYAEGFIMKDFTKFEGDADNLPVNPDTSKFWTYQECKKNSNKLLFLNLVGDCSAFERIK